MKNVGIWIVIAFIGIGAAALALSLRVGSPPELAPNFTLRSLDDAEISLADYRGSVVILDFWATWCKPCTRTFPALHALSEEYAEQGVVLLIVSLDRSEEKARDYLLENGYATDNVLWGSRRAALAVKDLYDVFGIPRTFVIDREGYIRFSGHPTRLSPNDLEPWL